MTERPPNTSATRELDRHGVEYACHFFRYQEKGGTRVSSRELGVEEHQIIKTLIFEDEQKTPMVVLMHGDRQVSTPQLARERKAKRVVPCAPATAERHSGYQIGGTSPFGLRQPMMVYAERSIQSLPALYINGGSRGFLVSFAPCELDRVLQPTWVSVAVIRREEG